MKPNQCNYFPAKLLQASTQLEMASLSDLCKIVEVNNLNNVFIIDSDDAANTQFAVYLNGCLLMHLTNGFKTLEQYITATEKGFPSATEYYEAAEKGITKYQDYQLVKEAGIANIGTFEALKKRGFIKGFDAYKALLEKQPEVKDLTEPINNPYELYVYAQKFHFEDTDSIIEALSKGFTDASIYISATELGFTNYADYIDATQKNFRTNKELQFARANNIKDAIDLHKYDDLTILRNDDEKHDELLLLVVLSKIEQGKKVSVNKLHTLLQHEMKSYYYENTTEMPLWFTVGINSVSDVAVFLQKNIQVKNYGYYDADGEFFEIKKMRDRAVIIDASNVAHNRNGTPDKKVYAKNLVVMVDFLKQKGFEDITVIADASLRHKVADIDVLEKLQEETTYLISPKETSADMFIINYVKKHHCLVISNDTFRDWKILDPWVADNIDFYRLTFLVKGTEVLMPDLK
jgi:hypothetical protein